MADKKKRTFGRHFKRFFLRGLAVVLPSALTLWIFVKAYQWIDTAIAQPINHGIQYLIRQLMVVWPWLADFSDATPGHDKIIQLREGMNLKVSDASHDPALIAEYRGAIIEGWWNDHWYIHVIGLIVAIIAVYIAGRLVGGFVGRLVIRYIERLITSVPVVKKIYGYIKQIVDFLFGQEKTIKFNRVVAAEYPRRGIWSVGFQDRGVDEIDCRQGGRRRNRLHTEFPDPVHRGTRSRCQRRISLNSRSRSKRPSGSRSAVACSGRPTRT